MGELELNEQHSDLVKRYLEFARKQRHDHLKAINYLFQDVLDSRLLESSYTVDEVTEILVGLKSVVVGEARTGLSGAAHAQVLLLQQICSQAERWHLHLEANMSELENRSLLDRVKQIDEGGMESSSKNSPKIAKPEDDGPVNLLHKEIKRLSTIAAQQRDAMNDLEERVAIECTARHEAEVALQNALQEAVKHREQLCQLEADLNKAASTPVNPVPPVKIDNTDGNSEKKLKEELHQARAKLTLAEQELQRKVNETTAFVNLRRMLESKNEQLRELRAQLSKQTPLSENGNDETDEICPSADD